MAADHGVVAEGVSAYPQAVTPQMVLNFLHGGAGINVLARHIGAKVIVVDMGVASDIAPHAALLSRKIAYGTSNMAVGPAMSREQAVKAIEVGIEIIEKEAKNGLDIVGTGDMGIGNTTASSAITVAITRESVAKLTGRGTGIDDKQLAHKAEVIERALAVNKPNADDALDVLAKVGGFEIGGICGVIVGAAAHRIPVVIDGFISGAAALIAVGLSPRIKDYLIASHCSVEIGHKVILKHLGLRPILDLELRLGEGTGAALGISLVEAATKILAEMATFEEAAVPEKSSDN
jgi:nicotinate-nucleotide--dimethylbenzimidazole phosphoribosyltransferase